MAEQVAPTRSNLLQRRDQLKLANRGVDLLKRKRDALIAEFFDLVKSSLEARRALTATSQEAYFSLFLANAWDGPEAVTSLSLASKAELDVDIKVENLYGVKLPLVQPPEFDSSLPFSPVNAGARTLDAATEFRKLTEALIQVAATETRLRRIGEEIKKTNRRVNALEQVVIPGINSQIKNIRSVLDQRALEEVTVLKRIKAKLEAREEEGTDGHPDNQPRRPEVEKSAETKSTHKRATEKARAEKAEAKDSAAARSAKTDDKQEDRSAPQDPVKAANAAVPGVEAKTETKSSETDSSKEVKTDSSSDGTNSLLLGANPDKYVRNLKVYTQDVDRSVVEAILAEFGEAVNRRDAMTVACSQAKELNYIKETYLKDKLGLSDNDGLDQALQDVCEQMGQSNRNKSSVTFYYLLAEKFDKLSVWRK